MDIIASCKQNDGFSDIFRNIHVPNDTNHMQEVPSGGTVPEPTVIVFYCFTEAYTSIYMFSRHQINDPCTLHDSSPFNKQLQHETIGFFCHVFC